MSTKIKIRRDTLENWQNVNPVLSDGELALIKDTGEVKIGNGVSRVMEIPSINNSFNGYAYEKIKEANNIKDLANLSISCIDTDEIVIELFAKSSMLNNNFRLGFNGDLNDNYRYEQGALDGNNNVSSAAGTTCPVIHQTNFTTNHIALVKIFPKEKQFKTDMWNYNSGGFWREYLRYYYWLNDSDSVQTLDFMDTSNEDVACTCRIYKRVQIVAQAPYKKLVASVSNINQLNGMVINIDQDKKYEIEFLINQAMTSTIYCLCNNNTNSVYSLSWKGTDTTGNFQGGNDINNQDKIDISLQGVYGATASKIIFTPYNKIFQRDIVVNYNGRPVDYKRSSIYTVNEEIQTLNFYAPNDDIPCKFKVWEIIE